MKKAIKVGLITLLVILLALQLLLPMMFARQLKKGLEDQLRANSVQVKVDSFPAFELFGGQVDNLNIQGQQLMTKKNLEIEQVKAEFTNLRFQKQDQQWVVTEGQNPFLQLTLTEEAVNDYLATLPEMKLFEKFQVDLTTDQAVIRGVINFFSTQIQVQLSGDFQVAEQEKIIFTSNKLAVENVVVPQEVIDRLKRKLQVELDLTTLPLPLEVKEVQVSDDRLEVLGPQEN